MVTGQQFVVRSIELVTTARGYRFGAETTLSTVMLALKERWKKRLWFDCSELTEAVAASLNVSPPLPDGSRYQANHCRRVSATVAMATAGALLFRTNSAGVVTHVGISLGDGRTVEARSRLSGVGVFSSASPWTFGGLIPGVTYSSVTPVAPVPESPPTLKRGRPADRWVAELAARLNAWADATGEEKLSGTGPFGPKTDLLVRSFQAAHSLAVDGIVGPRTWAALQAYQ